MYSSFSSRQKLSWHVKAFEPNPVEVVARRAGKVINENPPSSGPRTGTPSERKNWVTGRRNCRCGCRDAVWGSDRCDSGCGNRPSRCRYGSSGCGNCPSGCGFFVAGTGTVDSGIGFRATGCRFFSAMPGIFDSGCGIFHSGFGTFDSGCGIFASGCRFFDSGCGIFDSGCGISASGSGCSEASDCRRDVEPRINANGREYAQPCHPGAFFLSRETRLHSRFQTSTGEGRAFGVVESQDLCESGSCGCTSAMTKDGGQDRGDSHFTPPTGEWQRVRDSNPCTSLERAVS
jgi:hypothetical protein